MKWLYPKWRVIRNVPFFQTSFLDIILVKWHQFSNKVNVKKSLEECEKKINLDRSSMYLNSVSKASSCFVMILTKKVTPKITSNLIYWVDVFLI